MSTYYVAGIPFDGYNALSHHGIKGQRWGIRRFQNPDGTLTEAGKARYGSSKEQKRLADTIIKGRKKLSKTPQVRHAVANLKTEVEKMNQAHKEYENEVKNFYENDRLYDEYSQKSAEKMLKDFPTIAQEYRESRPLTNRFKQMSDIELVKWFINNDDWGQGNYDPLTTFEESGDKRAKALVNADKAYTTSQANLSKATREYVKDFLGDYGDLEYKVSMSGFPKGLTRKVDNVLNNAIYYASIEKYSLK